MRQGSVVSIYAIPIGIRQADGWSTGPPGFRASEVWLNRCLIVLEKKKG